MTNYPTPDIWDGDRRITGTEDFHNDFDPTANPYTQPDRPEYQDEYLLIKGGRNFSAYSITLQPGLATKILGEDPTRIFFYVNAPTVNSVLIGEQSAIAQGLGYIVAGAEKLTATSEVYACPAGAQAVVLSYWVERNA